MENEEFQRDSGIFYLLIPRFLIDFTPSISPALRELFAYIVLHSQKKGFCYATNKTIGSFFKKHEDTISEQILKLEKTGLIKIENDIRGTRKDGNPVIVSRRIYPNLDIPEVADYKILVGKRIEETGKNTGPSSVKIPDPVLEKHRTPSGKNTGHNNINNNKRKNIINTSWDEVTEKQISKLLF